jgi:hypothetical protein
LGKRNDPHYDDAREERASQKCPIRLAETTAEKRGKEHHAPQKGGDREELVPMPCGEVDPPQGGDPSHEEQERHGHELPRLRDVAALKGALVGELANQRAHRFVED